MGAGESRESNGEHRRTDRHSAVLVLPMSSERLDGSSKQQSWAGRQSLFGLEQERPGTDYFKKSPPFPVVVRERHIGVDAQPGHATARGIRPRQAR